MEHRPSTTPRHRTLFWAALAIPDQLVTCCFSSTSVYCLQLLRGRPLFLFPCGLQVRAWCVVLDAGFLRVCPIQPHFLRSICLAIGSCCVSLVSTRKEASWSAWFFSLLTVGNEGYVQQTNKQNWTLNSNEQKVLRSHSKYIKPKNVPERETTRMFLNSYIKNLLLLSRSTATTHVVRWVEKPIQLSIVFWNNLDLSSQSIRYKQSLQQFQSRSLP